jgi:glycerate dehydrogenase
MTSPRPARCVFLDRLSIDCDDLDFSAIEQITDYRAYERSDEGNIIDHARDAEIIISNKSKLGMTQFEQLPELKIICVIATGTNNIDLEAAAERGIRVVNVKDYAAAAVSQHVMLLMLALAGNFLRYQQDIRDGVWQRQDQFCLLNHPIMSLQGKTLGLIGYGHIATAVEHKARAFDMQVIISQSLRPDAPVQADRLAFEQILQQSDFISLHCPLSEFSRNLFGKPEFEQMKNRAFLINTARGGIINEAELLVALKSGEIAGAALDSIEHEPPSVDDPVITTQLPNLIITPHNAWATLQARQQLVDSTAQNIRDFLQSRDR